MNPKQRALPRPAAGLFLAASLLFLAVSASRSEAQQPERLDAVLRIALQPASREALRRLPPLVAGQEQLPPAALALATDDGGVQRLGVFVRLADASGIQAIRAAGGVIGTQLGDIVSARIPLDGIETLAQSSGIAFVEAARAVRGEHDASMVAIGADQIRSLDGNTWAGATGEGALVAIYDSGLDLLHGDFRDDAGRSRVISVWDQVSPGNPPPGYTVGSVCDSAAIASRVEDGIASACPLRDFSGHGTHVAGSAAGDGSETGNGLPAFRYAGVAPNAKLVIVRGGNNVFFENLIIDGLEWIRQEAQRLDRPVVVNLSLGGQFGAHDGSRLYEEAIDALSGPGFIVVVSSGNHGYNRNTTPESSGRLLHARAFAMGTETRTFTLTLPPHTPNPNLCNGNFTQIGLWYPGADRVRIDVIRPTGTSVSAATGSGTLDDNANGRVIIDNGSGGPDPRNGEYGAQIAIDGCGSSGAPAAGTWTVRVTPEIPGSGGPIDLWVEGTSHGNTVPGVAMQGAAGFDNRFIVNSPGNATRSIAVGAFATRVCWPSVASSNTCYVEREEVGDLARFSSGGPRRDGVLKPEIAAPGLGIVSARSGNAGLGSSRAEPDGVHSLLEGTSMAAPHVTGSVAVLYQVKPDLTPEEAKSILAASANQDAFTQRIYDASGVATDWWGAGKLDVRSALLALTGSGPAILSLSARSAVPAGATRASQGTRIPLLSVRLGSQGTEAIDVTSLTFEVEGVDTGARLVLFRDANGNREFDGADVPVDSVAASLSGGVRTVTIDMEPGRLRVPALGSLTVFAVLSAGGGAPHGSEYAATFIADATNAVGVESGEENELSIADSPPSGPAGVTVLTTDELLSFSANPVRCPSVVFNFAEPPSRAAVYTIAGRRVIDFPTQGVTRIEWALNAADGGAVAPGVYLVVFSVAGQLFREKLMVAPLQNHEGLACAGGPQ